MDFNGLRAAWEAGAIDALSYVYTNRVDEWIEIKAPAGVPLAIGARRATTAESCDRRRCPASSACSRRRPCRRR